MDGNAVVVAKVVEQTICTAVEVISSDYRRVWFHETGDDIEGRHA